MLLGEAQTQVQGKVFKAIALRQLINFTKAKTLL